MLSIFRHLEDIVEKVTFWVFLELFSTLFIQKSLKNYIQFQQTTHHLKDNHATHSTLCLLLTFDEPTSHNMQKTEKLSFQKNG